MYINKIQAINIAIEAIQQLPQSYENKQAIERLETIKNECQKWTKELVFKQLDTWKKDHNRNPTVTDLIETGMPKAVTIKELFDMRASAFLNIYYPRNNKKPNTSKYSVKTLNDWINIFTEQYSKIKPKSAKEYDVLKDPDTPNWLTIARHCNLTKWNELVKLTKVDTSHLTQQSCYDRTYTVKAEVPLYVELKKLLDK